MNFGQICHTPLGEDSFAHGNVLFRDETIHCSINFLRGSEAKMMCLKQVVNPIRSFGARTIAAFQKMLLTGFRQKFWILCQTYKFLALNLNSGIGPPCEPP
jgi:hypothetical protein